eukprot:gnl/Chilomastix_caulleri/2339.p1 GENE.gnl/Chilomastix_caulleri/2339~~gnl/Chilomastix_caulleri/2339.p1  ORF type:complete len:80 (+),score=0.24 gnl/Chilomastix_caulleri/2339:87-326(+)
MFLPEFLFQGQITGLEILTPTPELNVSPRSNSVTPSRISAPEQTQNSSGGQLMLYGPLKKLGLTEAYITTLVSMKVGDG